MGEGIGSAAAQQTKSMGKSNFTSDSSKNPENMAQASGTAPATGNPLQGTNYNSNYKWGQLGGTNDKWPLGQQNISEEGMSYEGEKYQKKLINTGSYQLFIRPDK